MLNQIVIAGRLVGDPEIVVTENNKKRTMIVVAVPRCYKNIEGNYDTDFIKCTLWNGIAENTVEYCNKGDIISVKGRLECLGGNELQVIAEKVTFLANNKNKEE